MANSNDRRYNVDGPKLAALQATLKEHNLNLDTTQEAGEVEDGGFVVDWNVKNNVLELELIKHPFAEAGEFWSKVEAILGEPIAA